MTTNAIPISQSQSQPSRRWLWILLGAVLVWLVFSGAGSLFGGGDDSGPPVAGATEVAVRDNVFEPAAIEIPVGTTVTWQWEGDTPHNVVGEGFESPVQDSGEFAYTFDDPGTFDYQCTLHGGMRGQVVVTEASA